MKDIKVLGVGCAKCKATVKLIDEMARQRGADVHIEKVEDLRTIMTYQVMSTPAVVVDGKLVHSGGVPTPVAIAGWLAG